MDANKGLSTDIFIWDALYSDCVCVYVCMYVCMFNKEWEFKFTII